MGHGPHSSDNYRSRSPLHRLRPARTERGIGGGDDDGSAWLPSDFLHRFLYPTATSFFIFACCQAGPSRTELQHLRLRKRTTTEKLREDFSHFGEVLHDRVTGYSKGLGFVKYATLEDATKGIGGMHGKFLDGWVIFAEYARPRPPASQAQINGFPLYRRPQTLASSSLNRHQNTCMVLDMK